MQEAGKNHVAELATSAVVTVTFHENGLASVMIHPDFEVDSGEVIRLLRALADEMETDMNGEDTNA